VACTGGQLVLTAGERAFRGSSGRWSAHEAVFRRGERFRECSVVREGYVERVFRGSGLPVRGNVAS
jgi:hypothetical protein